VACVLAVFVHSLTYNAFFEDPYMWLFMALASAVATRLVLTRREPALSAATDGEWSPAAAAKAAARDRDAGATAPR